MPRPSLEEDVRVAVREYLLVAETLSAVEAPLTTLAVANRLNFNRKTLKKYGLDQEIVAAAKCQARNSKLSPKEIERRSMSDPLRQRDQEIQAMRRRCEALIARYAWRKATLSGSASMHRSYGSPCPCLTAHYPM
jgi:hypothetical protein